jgi:hypothetical protein
MPPGKLDGIKPDQEMPTENYMKPTRSGKCSRKILWIKTGPGNVPGKFFGPKPDWETFQENSLGPTRSGKCSRHLL